MRYTCPPCASLVSLIIVCLSLASCASFRPHFDPPKVTVESVKSLPSEDIGPRFEIKLRVSNPSSQTLDIAGISYTIDFLGRELVSGVTSDIPIIEAYSEEVVTLEAGVNMFQVLRVLASLGKASAESLEYRFAAKIDFNGFIPTQRVEEVGVLSLQ
ncbi:MAG: LEA14-like dessication related protein [Cryomorphaceae bacterium]